MSECSLIKLFLLISLLFLQFSADVTDDYCVVSYRMQSGEVWTEVMSELQEENVRPVTPDRDALEAISAAINIRAEQVIQVQQELLEAQKQQDLTDEQEFYAQVSLCIFSISTNLRSHSL